jgi:hypothetical protein
LARTFADAGHPIALLARDTARLDSYVAELNTPARATRGYTADAPHPAQLRTAIQAGIDDLGAPSSSSTTPPSSDPTIRPTVTTTAEPTPQLSRRSV